MAIEQFGESLLASKRDKEKKEKRSEMRNTLLLGTAKIGLDLYGKSIEKKAQDFASNEQVWSNRVKYKETLDKSQTMLTTLQGADNYAGGLRQWTIDNIAEPEMRKKLNQIVPEEQYGTDSLGSYTRQKAEQMVDGYVAEDGTKVEGILSRLQEARTAATNLKGMNDYDAMVKINNNTPTSIADSLYQKVFGKKDAGALQQEAINNIVNSKFSKNAEAAQVAMDAFYGGATVKDSELLAADFAKAVEEKRVKEKATVQSKKGVSIFSAIQGSEIDVIEVTSTNAKGGTKITYEAVEGGLPLQRLFEEEETVVDIFKVETKRKVHVMRDLLTGEKVASTPNSTTKKVDKYPDNSVALLKLPKDYVANVGANVSLVAGDIILNGKAGNEILSKFTADAGDPEAAAKNVVDQIALAGANLTGVTDEAITLTTAGTISMAIAVNEANRANIAKATLGKANPKTMFGKPNAILVLEGIATLQNTGNELSKTEAEKAASAILAAHSSMDVMDKDTQKRTTQLLADFKNIDPNVRHSIIMGDAVSKFTGNIALEKGTLHELLVETHRNILQNEIATGTLIPDEEIENFLASVPTLATVNAAASAGSTTPTTSQKKTSALPPFGGQIAQLSRLEDPLREALATAQASAERSQAIVDDLIERKSTNTKSARASLAARLADLKEKEDKLNSFLATKQSLLGKPGAA
jgi:hypothetical protein